MEKSKATADILAEGLKELMREKSIEKIRIQDITDRAGVNRATFYKHFADKYQVVEYIFRRDVMNPMLPLLHSGLIREGILFMLTRMGQDFDFYHSQIGCSGQNSLLEMIHDSFLQAFLPLFKKQLAQPAHRLLTPLNMAEYCTNIFEFVLKKWLNGKEKIPVDVLMELYDLIINNSIEDLLRGELAQ